MKRYYLILRPQDTNDWFPSTNFDNTEVGTMDMVDAIMCALIVTKTKEHRINGLIIAEAYIADVETGEQIGTFVRSPQTNLFSKVNG